MKTLLLTLSLLGSTSNPATDSFTLRRAEAPVAINKTLNLSYVSAKDARCPKLVLCVWEGFVVADFILESTDGSFPKQNLQLRLDRRYKGSDTWLDEASGLTIILDTVTPDGADLATVRVGYQPL